MATLPARIALQLLAWLGVLLTAAAGLEPPAADKATLSQPFFQLKSRENRFAGPGREEPEPPVAEVKLAWFGPSDPSDPEAGDLWCAAQLAIDQANATGGYRGRPFRLLPAWSRDRWGSGVAQLVRLAYDEQVWAIVGGVDGDSTHLAEQVVAKAHLPLVSPVATDKTVNLANVPWMFSCMPSDAILARAVADGVADGDAARVVVLSTDDHDARLFLVELFKEFAARRIATARHVHYDPATGDPATPAAEAVSVRPSPLVVVAPPAASAELVRAVRQQGYAGVVLGDARMGRRPFALKAGEAADGVRFPLLYAPRAESAAFEQAFRDRFQREPDYASAGVYDAVRLLVAAVRDAGLNRVRIGDALRRLSPWQGVCGPITWDNTGSAMRAVELVPLPASPRPLAGEGGERSEPGEGG